MGDLTDEIRPRRRATPPLQRRQWSRATAIESWAVRLRKQARARQIRGIYIFANNHYEGFAPATCRRLAARLGIDIVLPAATLPKPPPTGPRQLELL